MSDITVDHPRHNMLGLYFPTYKVKKTESSPGMSFQILPFVILVVDDLNEQYYD